MGNGTAAGQADRQLAPAITGRERADNDPPIIEQWQSEILEVKGFLDNQTERLRMYTDRMFGSQPQPDNEERAEKGLAEIRPGFDMMGNAIMSLHRAKDELLVEMERLEAHRLV